MADCSRHYIPAQSSLPVDYASLPQNKRLGQFPNLVWHSHPDFLQFQSSKMLGEHRLIRRPEVDSLDAKSCADLSD